MNLTQVSKIGTLALTALAFSAVVLLGFSGSLPAQSMPAQKRISQAVDANDRVALVQAARPWVRTSTDLGPVAGNTAASHMLLLLGRSDAQQQALTEYLSDLQNPASPSYHHWLTQGQFADAYGVNADDVQAVTSWLESQGLAVEKVAKARNLIQFSGTVSQVQRAFQANIHRFSVNGISEASGKGSTEATSLSAIQVPRALAPVIRGLVNLDSAHAHSLAKPGSTAKFDPAARKIKPDFTLFGSAGPQLYVDPADAAVIYDTPNAALNPTYKGSTLDGTGVTVGVVGVSNVELSGVSFYRQAFLGETAANVNLPTVVVDGNDPGLNGAEIESFLDLEVLGGIAPKAKILYYASNTTDLTDGLQTAIARAVDDNQVSILSISYGSCEAGLGTTGNAFYSELYQQAAAQGISITVSSGDSGSANCDNDNTESAAVNGLTVNGLASTPYNIAVGGTDYDVLATDFETYVSDSNSGNPPYYLTALKYIPEQPWNDSTIVNTSIANNVPLEPNGVTNIIAAGGGVSSVYGKPAYQTKLTPKDGGRDLPDVSFLAANGLYDASWVICATSIEGSDCQRTNGQFTDSSTFTGVGGTSASTPAFAGMLALVEQSTGSRLGQANNILYQLAATKYSTVFHDVASGDNSVACASGAPDCNSNGFLTGYDAVKGYDLASGLGSVDVAAMVKNWSAAVTTSTGTTLTIDGATTPLNITHGATLDFAVAVTPATTGTAALVTNTTTEGGQLSIPITKGSGSASYNGLPGGAYNVYARYGGDSTDAASSSSPIAVTIAPEASTTALTLNPYDPYDNPIAPTSIPYGSYVFIEASVFGTAEGASKTEGLATGLITYVDNGKALGTAQLSSLDYASFPNLVGGVNGYYYFPAGSHSVVATYPGDVSYKASASAPATFTVAKGITQIQVVPNTASTTSVRNDIISVNIVTAGIGNGPTGSVTLQANGVTIGTTTNIVSGSTAQGFTEGIATFTVAGSQLIPGANALAATYTGDTNYVSGSGTGTVTMVPASFSLTASAISVNAGATTGNTAIVRATPLNDFTGIVNLACSVTTAPAGATSPVTCTVTPSINLSGLNPVSGTLTANTTTTTTAGAYIITITGTDAATGKIVETTISTVTVISVTPVTPAIALSSSGAITLAPGASSGNSATISITPSGGFTGAVALTCSVTPPTGAVDPIACTLSTPSVTVSGSSAATTTLTVTSTAASASVVRAGFGFIGVLLAGMLLLLPARKRLTSLACVIALISFAGIVSGCGGSSHSTPPTNPGTTAGAYVVTVTGTASGATSASTTVNVTVN